MAVTRLFGTDRSKTVQRSIAWIIASYETVRSMLLDD